MDPLASLFAHFSRRADASDPWQQGGALLCRGLPLSEDAAAHLSSLLLAARFTTPLDAILPLQRLLFLSVAGGKQEALRACLRLCAARTFWKELQLGTALVALVSALLRVSAPALIPELVGCGAPPAEYGGHWRAGGLPKLAWGAELGCVWAALGYLHGEPSLIQAAFATAAWQSQMADHRQFPFYALWETETSASASYALAARAALFFLCGKLSGGAHWTQLAHTQLEHLDALPSACSSSYPYVPLALARWMGEQAFVPGGGSVEPVRGAEDRSVALTRFCGTRWSGACTLLGSGTGLGAVHGDSVRICTFGPQGLPLGDPTRFGIQRMTALSGQVDGVLKGWVSLYGAPDVWVEVLCAGEEEGMNIHLYFERKTQEQLAFVFFVAAERALVAGGERLVPGTLERHVGGTASVCFEGSQDGLAVEAGQEGEMQVIPLAGGGHFWGAHFLLAFTLSPLKNTYSWYIRRLQNIQDWR
jgi:hypothetical protein